MKSLDPSFLVAGRRIAKARRKGLSAGAAPRVSEHDAQALALDIAFAIERTGVDPGAARAYARPLDAPGE